MKGVDVYMGIGQRIWSLKNEELLVFFSNFDGWEVLTKPESSVAFLL